MLIKFEKLFQKKDDLKEIDQTNPFYVAACAVNIMCAYDPKNQDDFLEMLQILMGDVQPINSYLKQNIKDRMTSNDKWKYIGKSYFVGSSSDNDYTPSIPYQVEVIEDSHLQQEGMFKLFVKNSGADFDMNPKSWTVYK